MRIARRSNALFVPLAAVLFAISAAPLRAQTPEADFEPVTDAMLQDPDHCDRVGKSREA